MSTDKVSDATLERLGLLVDKAENYLAGTKLPLPDHLHIQGLAHGLVEIRDEIKALYLELGGDDVWADRPGGE